MADKLPPFSGHIGQRISDRAEAAAFDKKPNNVRTADCAVCGEVVHYALDGSVPGAAYMDGWHHTACLDRYNAEPEQPTHECYSAGPAFCDACQAESDESTKNADSQPAVELEQATCDDFAGTGCSKPYRHPDVCDLTTNNAGDCTTCPTCHECEARGAGAAKARIRREVEEIRILQGGWRSAKPVILAIIDGGPTDAV